VAERSPADGPAPEFVARLGHDFADPELLATALRHRSWCVEHPGHEPNERLEFLGDAVLGLVVAAELYQRHPDLLEGRLTDARKAVVSTTGLAPVALELGLGEQLVLGRGEEQSGGRLKASLLENGFEAVVGAVFLDGGLDAAHRFVVAHLGAALERAIDAPGDDFKSRLQEAAARLGHPAPRYEVHAEGPDHAKLFHATVRIDGEVRGEGDGRTKKQAEQVAARSAMSWIEAGDEAHERRDHA
jgi:ribonuclease-3